MTKESVVCYHCIKGKVFGAGGPAHPSNLEDCSECNGTARIEIEVGEDQVPRAWRYHEPKEIITLLWTGTNIVQALRFLGRVPHSKPLYQKEFQLHIGGVLVPVGSLLVSSTEGIVTFITQGQLDQKINLIEVDLHV